jgi:translin
LGKYPEEIAHVVEEIRARWTAKNLARDSALQHARELTRYCAHSIRATHRGEFPLAAELLASARAVAATVQKELASYPDLNEAGYTQDALKELAEAHIVYALVAGQPLPTPEALGVDDAAYLNGLGEAMGELRRHVLDLIRRGQVERCEPFLNVMDEVYTALMTLDFPDALTGGLRRTSDMVRGVVERTRGDLTVAIRQEELQAALRALEERIRLPREAEDAP